MSKKKTETASESGAMTLEELAAQNGQQQPATEKPIEPKDVRFKRLANKRVNAALKRIGYVRNLANRNQYTYTDEQGRRIFTALLEAVEDVKAAFDGNAKRADNFAV